MEDTTFTPTNPSETISVLVKKKLNAVGKDDEHTSISADGQIKTDTNLIATGNIKCTNTIHATTKVKGGSVKIGNTTIGETQARLIKDISVLGQAVGSKVLTTDVNKDVTNIKNIYGDGTVTANGGINVNAGGTVTGYNDSDIVGNDIIATDKLEIGNWWNNYTSVTREELDKINGITTLGTGQANKLLTADGDKDIIGIRKASVTNVIGGTVKAKDGSITLVADGNGLGGEAITHTAKATGDFIVDDTVVIKEDDVKLLDTMYTNKGTVVAEKAIVFANSKNLSGIDKINASGTLTVNTLRTKNLNINGSLIDSNSSDKVVNNFSEMTTYFTTAVNGVKPAVGKKCIIFDTTTRHAQIWIKTGNINNPTYWLQIDTANALNVHQPMVISGKYHVSTDATVPGQNLTDYTTGSLTINGTIPITFAKNKYIHLWVTITDEQSPNITSPVTAVTGLEQNNTSSLPLTAGGTNGNEYTWKTTIFHQDQNTNYTDPKNWTIRFTDKGTITSGSPPTDMSQANNIYKFINISTTSVAPTVQITHQGDNGDGNMNTYFDKVGPWMINGSTYNYNHYFWKPKLYQKFKICSNQVGSLWIKVQPINKVGNNLINNLNTALWPAQWPQYGKDTWNYYFSGLLYTNNDEAHATTFIALYYNNNSSNEINLYPMIDPNYSGGDANQYHNNIYTATTSHYKAGFISEEISNQKEAIGLYVRKAPSSFSGSTPIYNTDSYEFFNLFLNHPGRPVTQYSWQSYETGQGQTSYGSDPKILYCNWGYTTHSHATFSEAHAAKITYCDWQYEPTSNEIGHKWSSLRWRLIAI
tara:strand:+ start:10010 stop:12454 length:2445 start_codon:yes stop_codon:yes gene_type:complete